jgi:cbb3-type cytochrome oxidase maturation protein
MIAVVYLLPVALVLGLLGLVGFLWCLRTKQYDDLERAANRPLLDDRDEL